MMNKKHPGLNTNMDGEIGQGLFRRESSIRTTIKATIRSWSSTSARFPGVFRCLDDIRDRLTGRLGNTSVQATRYWGPLYAQDRYR